MIQNDTPSQSELVRDWLADRTGHTSDLPGIKNIEEDDRGVVIKLQDPLDLDQFGAALKDHEIEDSHHHTYLEVEQVTAPDGTELLNVHKVQELGNGQISQTKAGITYQSTDEIILGKDVMWSEGVPTDSVIKQTLWQISRYLSEKDNE